MLLLILCRSTHDKLDTVADIFSHDQEVRTLVLAIQLHQITLLTKLNKSHCRVEESIRHCHDQWKQVRD